MGKNVDWIIHYILDDPGPYPYLCNAHTQGTYSIYGFCSQSVKQFKSQLTKRQNHAII